jgi:glycosyltransferase involved in cell wall biosynthesis
VAKEQYVAPRSGWFSDRSACYLAAGRPVVTQDTGFGKFVPTGEGLFAYSTTEEAVAAIEAIAADYERHSAAAREIAREYFDAQRLLQRMLAEIGVD